MLIFGDDHLRADDEHLRRAMITFDGLPNPRRDRPDYGQDKPPSRLAAFAAKSLIPSKAAKFWAWNFGGLRAPAGLAAANGRLRQSD